jgi:hypothetical protein
MAEQVTHEEIWVSTGEGAEITGYHQAYLQQLSRKMWKRPEHERLIKVRNRANRYELWLPDLVKYINEYGYGPRKPIPE